MIWYNLTVFYLYPLPVRVQAPPEGFIIEPRSHRYRSNQTWIFGYLP